MRESPLAMRSIAITALQLAALGAQKDTSKDDLVSQLSCHAKHTVRNTPSALELGSPDADDLGARLGALALAGSLCSEHTSAQSVPAQYSAGRKREGHTGGLEVGDLGRAK